MDRRRAPARRPRADPRPTPSRRTTDTERSSSRGSEARGWWGGPRRRTSSRSSTHSDGAADALRGGRRPAPSSPQTYPEHPADVDPVAGNGLDHYSETRALLVLQSVRRKRGACLRHAQGRSDERSASVWRVVGDGLTTARNSPRTGEDAPGRASQQDRRALSSVVRPVRHGPRTDPGMSVCTSAYV
jgi:hypothetical protein